MNIKLTPRLLLSAYSQGIFPMADDDGEILWFAPDPRAIFDLDHFHVPNNLAKLYRQKPFELRVDQAFAQVIDACADRHEGTWISDEIREAYIELNRIGFAHSVETWRDGELVGGLYGVAIGGVFCGESMFHRETNASKIALVYLVERMRERGFQLLDTQFTTDHLKQFNCLEIPRDEYQKRLARALEAQCAFVD
ncbi:MAG TPA: leucyl/phenylalanyl-tRNA--protein transferase [Phycisphaerae bacterium]|nr:leucyl/phenylalanyl-tRNA--protein transferase [Phycisphaerae bacterium]